jgi:hypothetical protein
MLTVRCLCNAAYSIDEGHGGREFTCRACGAAVKVPFPDPFSEAGRPPPKTIQAVDVRIDEEVRRLVEPEVEGLGGRKESDGDEDERDHEGIVSRPCFCTIEVLYN